MYKYDKAYIAKKADELDFIRDTFEKVYRLSIILKHINSNPKLKDSLALKGGTAINFTIFNLLRLSVDIDFDCFKKMNKDEMLEERKLITDYVLNYMQIESYSLSPKSKYHHSLDSFVFSYTNSSGMNDNIKIEINYSLRDHLFQPENRGIQSSHILNDYQVNSLSAIEIFGSKINALLNRAAARDLYDVNNMLLLNLFDKSTYEMLKKCIIFYAVVSGKGPFNAFDFNIIDTITNHKIKTGLRPVIRKREIFDLDSAKERVKNFISELLILNDSEQQFIRCFNNKQYNPELLFQDPEIVDRIKDHPMALWKTRH
ncbi:MAG: nucleotidyl transferase AbiEii/AbiGii toxin family protein [Eubacteriales bacterium]